MKWVLIPNKNKANPTKEEALARRQENKEKYKNIKVILIATIAKRMITNLASLERERKLPSKFMRIYL